MNMIALRTVDVRNDFKRISEIVLDGNPVLIARPHNENLVMLSESVYNELETFRRNTEYLEKLEESLQELKDGKVVTRSMEELEAMSE